MNHAGSSWGVALLVALVAGCGGDERDSGIYGSGSATYDGTPDDEADEAESGDDESTTTTATTTADTNPTTDDDPDMDADASTSSSSSDDDPSTTSTSESESDGNGACGNGVIDGGEQCDGGQLAGFDCTDLGYSGGTLACDPVICVYDASGCTNDSGDDNNADCGTYCDECTCPSNACTMCCAQMGKVDACGGGMCSCF
jgi:hypothetical protein